jgi:hypothetical protein
VTDEGIQAARDPDEEGDFMAFEQLMAEAQIKKEKEHKKKDRRHETPRPNRSSEYPTSTEFQETWDREKR